MKFLVDRCAGRQLIDWLREQGHDVIGVIELGEDPGDLALLGIAAAEGRILITLDADFSRLAFVDRVAHCGIVRLPDVSAAERIQLMGRIITEHSPGLASGAMITVRGERIRIAYSPGQGPGAIEANQ